MNPMREVCVDKVVVHMGVGEGGDKLTKAVDIMRQITGNNPVRSNAKKTNPAFGIRKGAPSRSRCGDKSHGFPFTALAIIERKVSPGQFDRAGNFASELKHTDFQACPRSPNRYLWHGCEFVLSRNARSDAISNGIRFENRGETSGCHDLSP
jgi:large subunit ribosomal protein L5